MKLIPLEDRVVVKPQEAESKTAGGIVLPDTAKEKPLTGKVISVGPGKLDEDGKRIAMSVKKMILSCSANTAAAKSNWTARITKFCVKAKFSA